MGKRGKKKYPCPECGVLFAKKQQVNNHKKIAHEAKEEEERRPDSNNNNKSKPSKPDSTNPPPTRPDEDANNPYSKEQVEAERLSMLPLWGNPATATFNIGAQHVESLSSSKTFKDFAAAGTTHFKEFKIQFNLAKSWDWGPKVMSAAEIETKVKETGKKMKDSLCSAVANFRVAFTGATDPQSWIYKREKEEEKENELMAKKTVARNLFVSLSYLVPRAVPSKRLSLYVELAAVLATACNLGVNDKKWLDGVEEKWQQVVEMMRDELPQLVDSGHLPISVAGEQVASKLNRWSKVATERRCLALLRLRIGELIFNQAAVAVADKDFKPAIQLLEEVMQFGVEEVKALTVREVKDKNRAFFQDLSVLEADSRLNRQLAEALQFVSSGDALLTSCLVNYEKFHMDLVFGVEDKYKYALSLARGGDVEIVCLTYTKLAKLYLKVFTDGIHRIKAREILNDVMNYSKAINRNLYESEWYCEAAKMLKEMQEADQAKEDNEWQNRRKVALGKLTKELELLTEFGKKGNKGFVEAIFATFPPKHRADEGWKKVVPEDLEDDGSGWKNVLRKLVTIYHPDRVDKEKHGEEYHVLCEEITTELSRRYSNLKG